MPKSRRIQRRGARRESNFPSFIMIRGEPDYKHFKKYRKSTLIRQLLESYDLLDAMADVIQDEYGELAYQNIIIKASEKNAIHLLKKLGASDDEIPEIIQQVSAEMRGE